jgi:hypothetical protein
LDFDVMAQNFAGKVALVTGASRGIGQATALALVSGRRCYRSQLCKFEQCGDGVVAEIEASGQCSLPSKPMLQIQMKWINWKLQQRWKIWSD